jgi:hypothetical protein
VTSHGCQAMAHVDTSGAARKLSTAGCITHVVNESPLVELNPQAPPEVVLKCIAAEGVEARCPIEAKHFEGADTRGNWRLRGCSAALGLEPRCSQLSFSKASELVRDGAHTPHR